MSYPEQPGSPGSVSRRLTNRNTNRYSVTALFSMAAEQDVEVEDELAKGSLHLHLFNYMSFTLYFSISAETASRLEGQNLGSIKEKLRFGARRPLS
jgi:hypothetical protein